MPAYGLNPVTIRGYRKIHRAAQVATSTTGTALAALTQPTAGSSPLNESSEPKSVEAILIQNDEAEGGINVLVGNSTAQVIKIVGGASMVIPVTDPTEVYVKSASGTPNINVMYLGD